MERRDRRPKLSTKLAEFARNLARRIRTAYNDPHITEACRAGTEVTLMNLGAHYPDIIDPAASSHRRTVA